VEWRLETKVELKELEIEVEIGIEMAVRLGLEMERWIKFPLHIHFKVVIYFIFINLLFYYSTYS
jgi:hypothetical protein